MKTSREGGLSGNNPGQPLPLCIEDGQIFQGKAAKEAILRHLVPYPRAHRLAVDICDFYGDCLLYEESRHLASSYYSFDLPPAPAALKGARIGLQLLTSRPAEALCHELLHLHVRMRGYPMGTGFQVPGPLDCPVGSLAGMYPKIVNLLEHDLILETFLSLGFAKSTFLGCLSPPPDYRRIAFSTIRSALVPDSFHFSWWCLEYLRHWISTRHWVGGQAGTYASWALYWGSIAHPGIKKTARAIRQLIESGRLSDPCRHGSGVNTLLHCMKLPVLTEWSALHLLKGGRQPLVIPLTSPRDLSPGP